MILKFNKNLLECEPTPCCPGSEIAYDYSLALDENGESYLVKEEYNLQKVIDSFADECSIERIAIAHGLGDDLVMNKKPGVYLDENDIKTIELSQSQQAINVQLMNLYQGYKDVMSFDEFSNAVLHGNFEVLNKKVDVKEGENNA